MVTFRLPRVAPPGWSYLTMPESIVNLRHGTTTLSAMMVVFNIQSTYVSWSSS
jgi:hypothetical protein